MNKRKNPYTILLEEIRQFIRRLKYAHRVQVYAWRASDLNPQSGYRLDEVRQRVIAARLLGYETVLEADDSGMNMFFRKKPEVPFGWEN